MANEVRVTVATDADIVAARQRARAMAEPLGFSAVDLTLIATAISEVARNIVLYAGRGEIVMSVVTNGAEQGLCIVAEDSGPGIPDLERAMQDGYSTSNGLGLGLPGAKRMMDEFDIVSEVGRGTIITMTKWRRSRARRPW